MKIGKQSDLSNQGDIPLEGGGRERGEGFGDLTGFLLSFGPVAHIIISCRSWHSSCLRFFFL